MMHGVKVKRFVRAVGSNWFLSTSTYDETPMVFEELPFRSSVKDFPEAPGDHLFLDEVDHIELLGQRLFCSLFESSLLDIEKGQALAVSLLYMLSCLKF